MLLGKQLQVMRKDSGKGGPHLSTQNDEESESFQHHGNEEQFTINEEMLHFMNGYVPEDLLSAYMEGGIDSVVDILTRRCGISGLTPIENAVRCNHMKFYEWANKICEGRHQTKVVAATTTVKIASAAEDTASIESDTPSPTTSEVDATASFSTSAPNFLGFMQKKTGEAAGFAANTADSSPKRRRENQTSCDKSPNELVVDESVNVESEEAAKRESNVSSTRAPQNSSQSSERDDFAVNDHASQHEKALTRSFTEGLKHTFARSPLKTDADNLVINFMTQYANGRQHQPLATLNRIIDALKSQSLLTCLNANDYSRNCLIHVFAETGDCELLTVLLSEGQGKVDVNIENGAQETALHIATRCNHPGVVHLLLLDDNIDVNRIDKNEYYPFDVAAELGRVEIIKMLTASEKLTIKDPFKIRTAMHWAASEDQVPAVDFLIERRPEDVVARDKRDELPIHCGATSGSNGAVTSLVRANADTVHARNCIAETALFNAAKNGHIEVMETLLRNNANMGELNSILRTALEMAALHHQHHVVAHFLGSSQTEVVENGTSSSANGDAATVPKSAQTTEAKSTPMAEQKKVGGFQQYDLEAVVMDEADDDMLHSGGIDESSDTMAILETDLLSLEPPDAEFD